MEYISLKDVCKINMGQSPDSSSYNNNEDGIPFFQGNADFGERYPVTRVWCNAPTKIAQPEDILISVRAPIGALNFAKEECCIGRGLAALTPDRSKVSLEYIYWFLKGKNKELNRKGTGSTFKAISRKILEETKVPVIDFDKQHEYAEILEKIYSVIQMREKELSALDNLIKARFVEMFGDPITNPMGWEQVTLNDVCSSIVRGPFGSALKKEFFVEPDETTYKVYEQKHAIQKSASIGTYYITEEKYQELKRFECLPGDILMSCSGTMGELYQLPDRCEKGVINQALCKFTLNERILPICFLVYMKQTIGNLETKGSGIQNIAAVSYVKQMPINLPPMDVQNEFEQFVEQVDKSKLAFLFTTLLFCKSSERDVVLTTDI
ncbi:MAG: restriction endonuclease subunit S [Clostridiales bacterium]|nr:restriction endonuclease subunit S [Clostridiales bacterium]